MFYKYSSNTGSYITGISALLYKPEGCTPACYSDLRQKALNVLKYILAHHGRQVHCAMPLLVSSVPK